MYSSANLVGGLGNQMFQIAHAYAQAWQAQEKGFPVVARFSLYAEGLEELPHRQPINYQSTILRRVDFAALTPQEASHDNWKDMYEAGFNYTELVPEWDKSIKFNGYFQSPKYFKRHQQNVRELFEAPDDVKKSLLRSFPQLAGNVTALFVRRGDYLNHPDMHPTTTEEYLKQAIEINSTTAPEHYLVSSDDLDWCDTVLPKYLPKKKIISVPMPDWQHMWAASICRNFICTNSSFGWWSAFLSTHIEKQVIFPATWCGPAFQGSWQDIYTENSIIL
jgi:hypothetical protein